MMTRQIVVRVPDAMLDALQRDAEDNGRTLAQTVRFLLRKSFPAASLPRSPEVNG